jgi:hypothetical protein
VQRTGRARSETTAIRQGFHRTNSWHAAH